MKWLLLVLFLIAFCLWSLCQIDQMIYNIPWIDKMAGPYAMLTVFVGSSIALMTTKNVQSMLTPALRMIGTAQILVVFGQLIWIFFYKDGAVGNAAIIPSIPAYISAILFAYASFSLYMKANKFFGVSMGWLIGAVTGAVFIVVTLSTAGLASSEKTMLMHLIHALTSILSSFTALLMIGIGLALRQGSWGRWLSPLAIAFAFYLTGNVVIAITGNYNINSLANWCWFISSSIILVSAIALWSDWGTTTVNAQTI